MYLNSVEKNPVTLWDDAKRQMIEEVRKWPYDFPTSPDFPPADQRGLVYGQLRINDRFMKDVNKEASNAFVGLAAPGEAGSWQVESKGYQFWVQASDDGYFIIKNVRPGTYNLYAWVPGYLGDYVYAQNITITPGENMNLKVLTLQPPRYGPTLWEIGVPDRTAAEFFVPDPNPTLANGLYNRFKDQKFRQYGLWERYTDLYPNEDLTFTADLSVYQTDWFFAHVTRKIADGRYQATTWKILFNLKNVQANAIYVLRIALASATNSELQVRVNDPNGSPDFTSGLIGRDNAIARHGIHGLYRLFRIDILGDKLVKGENTIFLTQARSDGPFSGIMYDYIRLEGPPM
uniref:Rhamnogalacturonan endolyase n=1 Tax=Kalanchoe fedtschenkoi TaxID=63787 RepID=A0A7N0ZVB8_KALFE